VDSGIDTGCYCGGPGWLVPPEQHGVSQRRQHRFRERGRIAGRAPSPADPFLRITGSSAPGSQRQLDLYGPPARRRRRALIDLAGLVFPVFDGDLWLDLSTLFQVLPFVTSGQDLAVSHTWTLPASSAGLEGLCLAVQAVFPTLPGGQDPRRCS